MIIKTAIIRKLKSGKYRLYSKKKGPDGERRNLGTYDSLDGAKKREQEVQYFKHHADDGETYDKETQMLSDLSDIAAYLEKAGFTDKADKIYAVMDAMDGQVLLRPVRLEIIQKSCLKRKRPWQIHGHWTRPYSKTVSHFCASSNVSRSELSASSQYWRLQISAPPTSHSA